MNWDKCLAVGLLLALLAGAFPPPDVQAQSSEPGQTIQDVIVRGQGRIEPSPVPANISPEQAATEYFATRPDAEYKIPRTARTNLAQHLPASLSPQMTDGNPVRDRSQAAVDFTGFKGLNHLDQRSAGTGVYENSQFSLEPPDQALCVGNGFIVEAVNTALAVYDTSGKRLSGPTALNQFFTFAPAITRTTQPVYGDFISDPKCLYDPTTDRFFMTLLQIDVDPQTGDFLPSSHTEIAVSQTSDPTGDWNFFRIVTTDNGKDGTPLHTGCEQGCLGDQPLIGVDAYGFYITTNEFSLSGVTFNGAQVYAMSKQALVSGRQPKVVHIDNLRLAEGPAYSLQPATTPDESQFELGSGGTQYFLSALDFDATLDNRIAVWALTNTSSLEGKKPKVKLTSSVIDTQVYGQPPAANQKAGPIPLGSSIEETETGLETNDDRMNQTVFANGKLYSAVNSIVIVGGKPKAGIAYFVVSPKITRSGVKGSLAGQGTISVADSHVFFPSIAVTSDGTAVMTFTLAGDTYFPSAAFAVLDQERPEVQIADPGVEPNDGFTGYQSLSGGDGNSRWGDYSAAVSDGNTIWLAAEYNPGGDRTQFANWGTFVTQITP